MFGAALLRELDEDVQGPLGERVRALCVEARKLRPETGSDAERDLLVRLAELDADATRAHATSPVDPNRWEAVLEAIFEADAGVEQRPRRRLALRFLEDAARTMAAVVAMMRAELACEDDAEGMADETVPPARVRASDPDTAAVLRLELALLVALSLMRESDDEAFVAWARTASHAGRHVEVLLRRGHTFGLRGQRAHARAQRVWDDWDEDDVEVELAPWPGQRGQTP